MAFPPSPNREGDSFFSPQSADTRRKLCFYNLCLEHVQLAFDLLSFGQGIKDGV